MVRLPDVPTVVRIRARPVGRFSVSAETKLEGRLQQAVRTASGAAARRQADFKWRMDNGIGIGKGDP